LVQFNPERGNATSARNLRVILARYVRPALPDACAPIRYPEERNQCPTTITLLSDSKISSTRSIVKTKYLLAVLFGFVVLALGNIRAQTIEPTSTANDGPIFKNVSDLQWNKIIPELGESSPEISILRIDQKTGATNLLIRTSKPIHVRKHWHTANESHTMISGTAVLACEGRRAELKPGGFNYMPAKMVHEAWLPANSLTYITVDGPWDINWIEGPPTAADLTQ
jgi:mannose-6-phosphate isomerase-like protein (cupin superfamily)